MIKTNQLQGKRKLPLQPQAWLKQEQQKPNPYKEKWMHFNIIL